MKIQQYGTLLVAGLLSMLSIHPVAANQCDQPSPLQEMLGENYWDVEFAIEKANQPIDSNTAHVQDKEAFSVLELFDRHHYAKATGTRHICKGAPDQRRVVEFDSTLRVTANSDRARRKNEDALRLEYLERGDSKADKISFDKNVIFDLPEESHWQVSPNKSIIYSQVNRRRNTI